MRRWDVVRRFVIVLLVCAAESAMSATLSLTSPAFQPKTAIPSTYTCDGANTAPPLEWSAPPSGTQSLALIVDDPDAPAGTWVHWVIFNLPPDARSLSTALPQGAQEGINDFQNVGYGGPCPPSGTHRYVFQLYALDAKLALPSGVQRRAVDKAMKGHILARAELTGTYSRSR
jgi:Raf kinase inhibitor-like YbhB/YbcL family protein